MEFFVLLYIKFIYSSYCVCVIMIVGEYTFNQIIAQKEELSNEIKARIADTCKRWGVIIDSIAIKDHFLSKDLSESLSLSAKAKSLAKSNLIKAKAEVTCARYRKQAADEFKSNEALQFIYLEQL